MNLYYKYEGKYIIYFDLLSFLKKIKDFFEKLTTEIKEEYLNKKFNELKLEVEQLIVFYSLE